MQIKRIEIGLKRKVWKPQIRGDVKRVCPGHYYATPFVRRCILAPYPVIEQRHTLRAAAAQENDPLEINMSAVEQEKVLN